MTAGPVLRLAGPDDDAIIRRLLAAAYRDNPKADAAVLRWQYWDNPFGATRSWIWELDGEAIAHWAAVAVPLVLDGKPVVGAKTADAATHPAHRRKGLFGTLALRYMRDLRDARVPAVLTHPNPDSAAGVEGSGAVLVERVPVFVRALDDQWLAERFHLPQPAAALLRRAMFGGGRGAAPGGSTAAGSASRSASDTSPGADAAQVEGVPDGLDELWARLGERWGVRRDAAWWRWRYAMRPAAEYRFFALREGGQLTAAGALHLRDAFGGRFGYVMEFLADGDAAARGLANIMAEAAREEGGVGLVLAATTRSRLAAQARVAGFRRLPRALEPNPLRFLVADPAGDSAVMARRPWAMSWGDLDHL